MIEHACANIQRNTLFSSLFDISVESQERSDLRINFSLSCTIRKGTHLCTLKLSLFAKSDAFHAVFPSDIHHSSVSFAVLKLAYQNASVFFEYFNCPAICKPCFVYLTLYVATVYELFPLAEMSCLVIHCLSAINVCKT